MSSLVFAVALMPPIGQMALAADALNHWQEAGASADGSYADAAHWSLGRVPDVGDRAYFSLDQSYRVMFPSGFYTNNAAIKPVAYAGRMVELDGAQTTLVRAADPSGRFPLETFGLYYGGTSLHVFNFEKHTAAPDAGKAVDFDVSNFVCRVSSSGPNRVRGEFVTGGYNFFDPAGTVWTTAPCVTLFGNAGSPLVEAELVFGAETGFRFPTARIQGNALTNRLVFAGGRHAFASFVYLPYTQGTAVNETDAATDLVLRGGAEVAFMKGVMFGVPDAAKGVDRRWRLSVEPGARLRQADYLSHYHGQLAFDIAGEWACAGDVRFNRGNGASSARVVVREGGILKTAAGKAFEMGTKDCPDAPSSLEVVGATLLNAAKVTVGSVAFTNAVLVNETGAEFNVGYAPTRTRATFAESLITNRANFTLGRQGPAHVAFDNTVARLFSPLYVGGIDTVAASAATTTVEVAGGSFELFGENGIIYVGFPARRHAVFNFTGGTLVAERWAPISVGWFGNGTFNVSGGRVSVNHLRTGPVYTDGTDGMCEDVVRVTGGVLNVTSLQTGQGLAIAENAKRSGRLILDGGVLKCRQAWGAGGTAAFEADGGTLEAIQSNASLLFGFADARLGAQGLTVDSAGHDVTIAQSFSDKADAAGTGRLILTGVGVKTLTGDLSALSVVEVRGGIVDVGGRTVKTLVLDGGALKIDPARPIRVTAGCDFRRVRLALAAGMTRGNAYSVLCLANPLNAEQLEQWTRAVAASGLGDGDALTFTQEADGTGGSVLRLEVRAAETTEIRLDGGRVTRSESFVNSAADAFSVVVAKDADLTLAGVLARGALVKSGGGAVTLAHADNLFVNGWQLKGGRMCAPSFAALGLGKEENERSGVLCDGTLEITGLPGQTLSQPLEIRADTPTNAVIVKVAGEVTMPAPKVTSGSFIKRGGGRLVWEVEGVQTLMSGRGFTPSRGGAWPFTQDQVLPLVFDEANGTVPSDGTYGCFNVTDGEMVLRGRGVGAAARAKGVATVGLPTGDGAVQPGLVLDNVSVDFAGSGQHFVLAPGGTASNTFVNEPYLVVSNGAALTVDTLSVNRFNDRADLVSCIRVADGSTLKATYLTQPNRSQNAAGRAVYEVASGSRLLTGTAGLSLFRPVEMTFDGSVLAKNEALEPTRVFAEVGTLGSARIEALFRNGAEFRCAEVAPAAAVSADNPIRLAFDDAKWIPTVSEDFVFEWTNPAQIVIAVTNVGLVLDVPAERTWTMNQPVQGPGGLVKRGAGTLRLGVDAVAYKGVTRVDEGRVDLDGGEFPLCVGGAGTVANGVIAQGGLALSLADDGSVVGPVPTLSGVATRGRFRVDCGRANGGVPFTDMGREVVVARYSGPAPDVSAWRAVNLGMRGLTATFEARDGQVFMMPVMRGLLLIVR